MYYHFGSSINTLFGGDKKQKLDEVFQHPQVPQHLLPKRYQK